MHQSVVEYDAAPASMSNVLFVTDRQGAPRSLPPGLLRSARLAVDADRATLVQSSQRGAVRFSSYIVAAAIAAGLVAAWAGLCVI